MPPVRASASSPTPRASSPSIALAHVGAARRIEVVGTLDEVQAALGGDAIVVRTRDASSAATVYHSGRGTN